ncbi:MAG: phosphoenolpyruvate--protein phosphotransferase [Hyphomicrobiales bacterium]|nr:phosphoenolpyruvate--protein phosphotransferase [Hyphomicrobiales bacterium]
MTSLALKGQCASPGFSAGIVVAAGKRPAPQRAIEKGGKGDPAAEALALTAAINRAVVELRRLVESASGEAADMLGFQIAMLDDEELTQPARDEIAAGKTAVEAWTRAMDAEIAGYEGSDEEYFRVRATDLVDMRERVLDALIGAAPTSLPPGSIVLADDITPSRFLSSNWEGGAILLRRGSATSHVAMLARSRGVPMIVGLQADDIAGRNVLIDATQGLVIVDPSPSDARRFEQQCAASRARDMATAGFLGQPAISRNGERIITLINIADPSELDGLDPACCDGIGLVRTELLFEGATLPSEDAQTDIYTRIVRWAAGKPVTFRTLDAGGDKPIAGLTPLGESNPFLGMRGVRLTLSRPDIFLPQLRALARAAAAGDVEIMIPMVTLPSELEATRALLHQACAELGAAQIAHRLPALGIMVEVPAAALTLGTFDAAFLSIGSNDLTQYVMAAGRDIAAVAALADPGHEAVLRLIGMIAAHGERSGIKVSLCGDAGGDERFIPQLLAHGVRILSMPPRLLAAAKQVIATVNLESAS